ncbi:FadR/GntR family transcriptional regulator [Shewanella gaetbuli]|uniref:FadR family transcriptional regulator n=1 Tax=Shewanella gaetbuli TaxID=220752 RepID=A0A9X1ZHX4_9GAMM|nr:FadR/GntR family transcriptional regulator [Shewanella gaetbuli]MCL1142043.1 FadR family transcriptional regulator [Shewanella gaetbuli]
MANSFNSISGSKRSLHLHVAREIARAILSGELPQNSIIPGEMALCEQFGISRTALREAVKLLTSKGLLQSRPKIGTRVVEKKHWNFLDPQLIEWMEGLTDTNHFCAQFLGFRRAIEPEACALAALNATVEQRKELSLIFQKMSELDAAPELDTDAWIQVDIDFHRVIFFSTGNDFYLPFGNILTTMFENFIAHSSEEGGTCFNEHKQIYEAIMSGNADKARQISLQHLQSINHRLADEQVA